MAGFDSSTSTSFDSGITGLETSLDSSESLTIADDILLDSPDALTSIQAMESTNQTTMDAFDGDNPFQITMGDEAAEGDHIHEQPSSPEEQYLDAVRSFINDTNAGDGPSTEFFQIADPDLMLPKVEQWVNNVDINPTNSENGSVAGKTTPDWETLAIFRGHPDGGTVSLPVNPSEDGKTAFHEAIHAADFRAGGDGIDDDVHYATHFFDNRVPGIIRSTRNLDTSLNDITGAIRTCNPEAARLQQNFERRLNLLERQVKEMSTDSGWDQAMKATGAKFDFAGYRKAASARIREAGSQ